MAYVSHNMSMASLNIKGLNISTERQRLINKIKNMTHVYAVYKKLTSNMT